MAYQLEVIKFRDVVTVTQIKRFVPGMADLTLEIRGEDFSSVEEVLVNSVRAPEFIILSKEIMWVVLPDAAKARIDTIEVMSSNFTKTLAGSKIQFKIGDKTRTVSGILKLVQLFTKWLLQSPGSDIFNPDRGGGLQNMIGRVTTQKMEPVMAAVTMAVSNVTSQIKDVQTTQTNLPMNERLLAAKIKAVNIYEPQMEARVSIDLTNMAGEDAISSIAL
jgi:hypothetical protein